MKLKETIKLGSQLLRRTSSSATVAVPATEREIDLQHEDDEALVRRTQKGDSSAFDVLVGRYKERLYATVYHMTSNHEDANDLVQDTFIKAYKSLAEFSRTIEFLHVGLSDRRQSHDQLHQAPQEPQSNTASTIWTVRSRPTPIWWS